MSEAVRKQINYTAVCVNEFPRRKALLPVPHFISLQLQRNRLFKGKLSYRTHIITGCSRIAAALNCLVFDYLFYIVRQYERGQQCKNSIF